MLSSKLPNAFCVVLLLLLNVLAPAIAETIPLPEHPRPDFQRPHWENLNGQWEFKFDKENQGEKGQWASKEVAFPETITVPFPWGSELSGLENKADIGWYRRSIEVPTSWKDKRIFLVVGASDWVTNGWLDGKPVGEHRGGYTPFEFELTNDVQWGQTQELTLRVDDTPHPFKLEGKQGYGEAKGIWQTTYLEARPALHITSLHYSPDIDSEKVTVKAKFNEVARTDTELHLHFKTGDLADVAKAVTSGESEIEFEVQIPDAHLWSLEDPFLYETTASLKTPDSSDQVDTYFGMRKISVAKLPGTDHPYVSLNNKPIYLQMSLDQSYHREGFYTFPSDEFMRDEILRSKRIGLNANRIHIKIEVPRKLYWADRLGLLIMADVPNFWGNPTKEAQTESEFALRGMVDRDYNHPAIFSWVTFNETWGLFTNEEGKERAYRPDTQKWVIEMYRLAKKLDPTRLVEDNSPCNYDHTETDLNTWHDYLPGYAWRDRLEQIVRDTHAGSKWNFIGGRTQGNQPLFNSECGNVWGYEGSTGDVDYSWDYHIMMNEFRRQPKIAGWLYTEHHDVINEWNGYYRFDRSEKHTGMDELGSGMNLKDLHSPFYMSTGDQLCRDVKPGETVEIPLFASFLTDEAAGDELVLKTELYGWDTLGRRETYSRGKTMIPYQPWMAKELEPLKATMPERPALAVLQMTLENRAGVVLQRNFTTFLVSEGPSKRTETVSTDTVKQQVVRFAPETFTKAEWTQKQWNVLDGLKVNGAGSGYFEYRMPWPEGMDASDVAGVSFVVETSAKQLFGKDREGNKAKEGDFMRGQGTHDPSRLPNAYPMTDTVMFPSEVRVRFNGISAGTFQLQDDPADHRGILSWHSQPHDRKLREAGSYGYLVQAVLPTAAVKAAAKAKEIVIRLEVDSALPGGLAIYGERFGRYPLDPTIVFSLK
ncbi:Beta-glucuronidase [Planctomycetes bacterium CA13]|uniref:Beta-glucuronidase n=1 Tax=Novipirellula herctigrandis TaxID=2527986 RepID=A0A5C5Z688_9BACT|nr:Beta-glucuronidase [Planctomycetes bacterium CA13]